MQHFDLVIVGAGSGNTLLTPDYDDWKVAIVERDLFGGTCLNRGCVPSKMFVHAADVAEDARHGPALGVHTRFDSADWRAIRDRVFGRIDPMVEGGRQYRVASPNITVFPVTAQFVGPRRLAVGAEVITGDQFVIAAGSRAYIPPVPGLHDVAYRTSDTIMRIESLPSHLIVMGGGFIATEMSHVFGGLGCEVTIINRTPLLLRTEDIDVAMRFTQLYRRRFELLLSTQVLKARQYGGTIELDVSVDGDHRTVSGDMLLVASGRIPNSDELMVRAAGVSVDDAGFVETDEYLRTSAPGTWALGDITNPAMLKHTANAEARTIAHNIIHPDDLRPIDRRVTPHAVFSHPQVASVGITEQAASGQDLPYISAIRDYASTAYGWALEDTESFCKVIADRTTRRLLGAHIIGPQASTLIQPLIQGMQFGQTVDQLAREQLYIHPALTEVVEQALLAL